MEPMSWQMREVLDEAIRMRLARDTELTPDYVDQVAFLDPRTCGPSHFISSAYTPWGVACIEAAFRYRMEVPHPWDTKDRIRRDIMENPHLWVTEASEAVMTTLKKLRDAVEALEERKAHLESLNRRPWTDLLGELV